MILQLSNHTHKTSQNESYRRHFQCQRRSHNTILSAQGPTHSSSSFQITKIRNNYHHRHQSSLLTSSSSAPLLVHVDDGIIIFRRQKPAHQLLKGRVLVFHFTLHGELAEGLPGRLIALHLHGVGLETGRSFVTHWGRGHHGDTVERTLQLPALLDSKDKKLRWTVLIKKAL